MYVLRRIFLDVLGFLSMRRSLALELQKWNSRVTWNASCNTQYLIHFCIRCFMCIASGWIALIYRSMRNAGFFQHVGIPAYREELGP